MKTATLFLLMMTPASDLPSDKLVFEIINVQTGLGLRECLRNAYEVNTLLGDQDKPWAVCAPEVPK